MEINILLKRSLESVVRISLYYQLQTSADYERMNISSLKFSEDISFNIISNFCEKQLIPSGATLIVQKPLFWHKNTNLC